MNDVMTVEDDQDTYTIQIGDAHVTVDDQVEADDVKQAAADAGIKKFRVEDPETGNSFDTEEFPLNSDVRVTEYNENA